MIKSFITHLDKIMVLAVLVMQLYLMTGSEFKTSSAVIKELQAEVIENELEFIKHTQWLDSTIIIPVRALAIGECMDRTYEELTQMRLNCERLFRDMGMTYIPQRAK